ncbi:hypothetical protein [Thorsellia kenyensis]|uniref:Uncharacterized protein n=1 Tax=Thorsellia kenyensis TaxID=1549888 RepID=A0ABV6CCV5_9GAMM
MKNFQILTTNYADNFKIFEPIHISVILFPLDTALSRLINLHLALSVIRNQKSLPMGLEANELIDFDPLILDGIEICKQYKK